MCAEQASRWHEEAAKSAGDCEWVALTTDGWSSKATQSFMMVTCHFISQDWKLVSAVLTTCHFPGSHTGKRIAEKVKDHGINHGGAQGTSMIDAMTVLCKIRFLKCLLLLLCPTSRHHTLCYVLVCTIIEIRLPTL